LGSEIVSITIILYQRNYI